MTTATSALTVAWVVLVAAAVLRHRPNTMPVLTDPGSGEPSARSRAPGPPKRSHRTSRRRTSRRGAEAAIAAVVPDVIDLFAVAIAAGLNARLALRAVAERAPSGDLAEALKRVEGDVTATGERLADAVERLPDELGGRGGDAVRPLVSAITDAERYGAALGPTLDRLAADARRARQRQAEEAARRIPVKLLFPLVTCILPAFGLLTVAPLIAGGLRALRL